jgi:hypothetical protein
VTREYRITSADFNNELFADDSCYLDPNDPVFALHQKTRLGGLGNTQALSDYSNSDTSAANTQLNRAKIQLDNQIKPGTPEWFALWFGNTR